MDEDEVETPTPATPAASGQIDKHAPEYVRQVQRFTKYIGHLAGAAATILYAVTQIAGGFADGCAALAKAHGIPVVHPRVGG